MTASSNLGPSLRLPGTQGQGLASDARGVDALRSNAARDPKGAVKETAKQFEALFMQELMKSMRQTSLSSGMLDNAGSQMGTEMLDTQYASMLTGMRGGLSDAITRQLERQMGGADTGATDAAAATGPVGEGGASEGPLPEFGLLAGKPPLDPNKNLMEPNAKAPVVDQKALASRIAPAAPPATGTTPARNAAGVGATTGPAGAKLTPSQLNQIDFVKRHTAAANAASAQTGIPASFMVAQAAHESGWGRREIRMPDGSNSFNVFGIKAGANWSGRVAEVTTTEYVNGQAHKVTAKFRAYDSYEAAFQDYAQMLKTSPRYGQVVAKASTAESFAQGLQRAGYATDPAYADKLTRVINTTLRLQRMVT